MNKKRLYFILIITTVIVFSSIAYIYNSQTNSPSQNKQDSIEKQKSQFKTYTNTKYGYEVDYPEGWSIKESSEFGDGVYLYNDNVNSVQVYASDTIDYLSTQDAPVEREILKLENGMNATALKIVDEEELIRYIISIIDNDTQYMLFAHTTEEFHNENKETFNKIAQSFRISESLKVQNK